MSAWMLAHDYLVLAVIFVAFAVAALLDAVETAREDFPDHFEQWEREVSA